jgi:hypothetical protein
MKQEITVKMTLEWTFNKKDWSSEQRHIKELSTTPDRVLGYDTLNSLYMLNDITRPEASNIKVINAN